MLYVNYTGCGNEKISLLGFMIKDKYGFLDKELDIIRLLLFSRNNHPTCQIKVDKTQNHNYFRKNLHQTNIKRKSTTEKIPVQNKLIKTK